MKAGERSRAADTGAYLLLVVTALCWAGNHVAGRWMAAETPQVPPGGLSVVRWALAALVILPFARKHAVTDWPMIKAHRGVLLFLGLVGGAGFSFTQYYALRYTSVVNVGIMNSIGPAFIIVAGMLIFRDRVRVAQAAGIAVSLAGVLIILMRGDASVLAALAFNFGDVIALLNMGIFAVYSACLRLRPQLDGLTFMLVLSVLAAAGSVPVMALELMSGEVLRLSRATIVSVVYTGLFTSVIAYLAWNAGVARLGAQRAGAFLHLVPLFGAILGVVLLGEPPRLYHAAGLVLIVAGVTLAARPIVAGSVEG
jgi:drug/metabolite transporter (DMT)-like permease